MKPFRLLIPVVAVCLLLASAHNPRSVVQGQALDGAPPSLQLRPNIPRPVALFHPRFYKQYGSFGLSSTLYLQNANQTPAVYTFDFYECASGALVTAPQAPSISPWATWVAGPDDFPNLPPGCYGLLISSDQPFEPCASVVEDTQSTGSATDKLATHTGFLETEAGSAFRFGPLLKGDVNSVVSIWNVSFYGSATVSASAYDVSGSQIILPSCSAVSYAQCTFDASALTQLPASFVGTLVMQSTRGDAVGIMSLDSTSGTVSEYRRPLVSGTTGVCLPRVLKHVNEGGGVRSTTLFVANAAGQAANVNLTFYDSSGAPVIAASQDLNLAANGSRYLSLAGMDALPDGAWSVCASGDQALALEELTQADNLSGLLASSATHGVTKLGSSDTLAVTHLMRSDKSYTAFSVQNPGSVAVLVDLKYYDITGALVHTESVNLPPKGWKRFNQSSQSELQNGFVGSPVVSGNQPVMALVDAYEPPRRTYLPLVLR